MYTFSFVDCNFYRHELKLDLITFCGRHTLEPTVDVSDTLFAFSDRIHYTVFQSPRSSISSVKIINAVQCFPTRSKINRFASEHSRTVYTEVPRGKFESAPREFRSGSAFERDREPVYGICSSSKSIGSVEKIERHRSCTSRFVKRFRSRTCNTKTIRTVCPMADCAFEIFLPKSAERESLMVPSPPSCTSVCPLN